MVRIEVTDLDLMRFLRYNMTKDSKKYFGYYRPWIGKDRGKVFMYKDLFFILTGLFIELRGIYHGSQIPKTAKVGVKT